MSPKMLKILRQEAALSERATKIAWEMRQAVYARLLAEMKRAYLTGGHAEAYRLIGRKEFKRFRTPLSYALSRFSVRHGGNGLNT